MNRSFLLGIAAGVALSAALVVGWLFWDASHDFLLLKNGGGSAVTGIVLNDVILDDIQADSRKALSIADTSYFGMDYVVDGEQVSIDIHEYGGSQLMLMTLNTTPDIQLCPKPLSYLLGNY